MDQWSVTLLPIGKSRAVGNMASMSLFIFVNNWVIRENESFLPVEPCSCVPKSRGDGRISC